MKEMMEATDDEYEYDHDEAHAAITSRNCGHCGSEGAKWTCGRCRIATYCNKQCQKNAWRAKHRNQCPLMYMDYFVDNADLEKAKFSNLCEILDKIFSNDSSYPVLETDSNMQVMVTDLVSFGDLEDAGRFSTEQFPVDGTIIGTIHTVRHFHPGVYRCTRAIPFENWQPVYIYHHENIDPAKIIRQSFLMMRDFNAFHRDIINSINRYDWTQWTHYSKKANGEDDDDEEFIKKLGNDMFFARTENASCLKECVNNECIMHSTIIPSQYTITSPELNFPIAMAVEIENKEDEMEKELSFIHGKAFQDISSQKYFALMIYTNYIREFEMMFEIDSLKDGIRDLNTKLSRRYPDKQFTSIKETELKFNITDFRV